MFERNRPKKIHSIISSTQSQSSLVYRAKKCAPKRNETRANIFIEVSTTLRAERFAFKGILIVWCRTYSLGALPTEASQMLMDFLQTHESYKQHLASSRFVIRRLIKLSVPLNQVKLKQSVRQQVRTYTLHYTDASNTIGHRDLFKSTIHTIRVTKQESEPYSSGIT